MKCLELLAKLFEITEKDERTVPTPKPTPKPEDNSPIVPDEWEQKYRDMYKSCVVRAGNESTVNWYVTRVNAGRSRYKAVAESFKMPWEVIGIIHGLEGSFSWDTYLGNGERIIGQNKKSVLVPRGRGPFKTWEDGAVDALNTDRVKRIPSWNLVETLYFLETFNGTGYRGKKDKNGIPVYSPYLWGLSNHHLYGKYVRDGVYSPSATTKQCGAALIMKTLGMFA